MEPCFDYALKHCTSYPKTEHDLHCFLLKKWYSHDDVTESINRLKELNFVDDELYTELYLQWEVWRKGKPLFLIQQKLYQKWVDHDIISFVTESLEPWLTEWMVQKIQSEYERLLNHEYSIEKIIKKLVQKWYPYKLVMESCSINE